MEYLVQSLRWQRLRLNDLLRLLSGLIAPGRIPLWRRDGSAADARRPGEAHEKHHVFPRLPLRTGNRWGQNGRQAGAGERGSACIHETPRPGNAAARAVSARTDRSPDNHGLLETYQATCGPACFPPSSNLVTQACTMPMLLPAKPGRIVKTMSQGVGNRSRLSRNTSRNNRLTLLRRTALPVFFWTLMPSRLLSPSVGRIIMANPLPHIRRPPR